MAANVICNCVRCGAEFFKNTRDRKFCSVECKAASQVADYTALMLPMIGTTSRSQIAKCLGITPNAVAMKLRRLRKTGAVSGVYI